MKLYTEEQVRKLIDGYYDVNWTIYDSFDELEPITLPSDEEIKILKRKYQEDFGTGTGLGFEYGAKWMKEQILNQNK